jgi:hypothetical protein
MSIHFACPNCKKPYRVKEELAGKTARCACGKQIKIPVPKPAAEPIADLTDLFDAAEEQSRPLAPISRQARPALQNASIARAGGVSALPKLLQGGGLVIAKLAGGALAGVGVVIWHLMRDKQSHTYELSYMIMMVLMAAIMGVAAAGLLIVGDAVGERSNAARWTTIAALISAIAVGVVVYFLINPF